MSRIWKEEYTLERARALGIHGAEKVHIIGSGAGTGYLYDGMVRQGYPTINRWIYFVRVCSFTFGFFSVPMLRRYRDYNGMKQFRPHGKKSHRGQHIKDTQSEIDRLPMRLRAEAKRTKVHKALSEAVERFGHEERITGVDRL